MAWLGASSTGLMVGGDADYPRLLPQLHQPHRDLPAKSVCGSSIGLYARCYLIYAEYPATFEGLKQSHREPALDRWIPGLLHHPIDAIFTRIWVGNSHRDHPADGAAGPAVDHQLLRIRGLRRGAAAGPFPTNLPTTSTSTPASSSPGSDAASEGVKKLLRGTAVLFRVRAGAAGRARAPLLSRAARLRAPCGRQWAARPAVPPHRSTAPASSTSAATPSSRVSIWWRRVDLPYLSAKGRRARSAIWCAASSCGGRSSSAWPSSTRGAGILFISRFFGGNMQSLVAFWQHGLVDPHEIQDTHGNCTDYVGPGQTITATSATTIMPSITSSRAGTGPPTTRATSSRPVPKAATPRW